MEGRLVGGMADGWIAPGSSSLYPDLIVSLYFFYDRFASGVFSPRITLFPSPGYLLPPTVEPTVCTCVYPRFRSPPYVQILGESDDSDAPVADDRAALPHLVLVLLDIVHAP